MWACKDGNHETFLAYSDFSAAEVSFPSLFAPSYDLSKLSGVHVKLAHLLICQYIASLQAGGHAKLIQIGNGYVGKPLIPREAEMYRLRPQKIAPFLPEFKGKYTVVEKVEKVSFVRISNARFRASF